jgi:preprotein translocase subunit SecF
MTRRYIVLIALMAGGVAACESNYLPSDQVATNIEGTGPFEIVRERATEDGSLEIRVRANNLDAANEIARKVIQQKNKVNQRVARIEFIGPKDDLQGPTRRVIQASELPTS